MAHILQLLFAATATNFMFVTICIHESANYQFKPLFTHWMQPQKRPRPLKMVSHAEVGDLAGMDSEFGFFQQVEEAEKEDKGFNSI